ncbi:extracellular solute-binding protein [Pseudaminobacter salicylatoxidans]|uniref:extracellular solute-binding protein n=1 Tax=Pseudaminobacter salicylatoxidans TaxID=93369 RepID=UPI0002DA84FA|nr:extracellular solute-binding protein [Pseudaminobacter salicylatoxidans]
MKLTRREFTAVATAAFAAMGLPRLASAQSSLVVPTYGGLWAKFWEDQLLPGFAAATGVQPQIDVGLGKDFVSKIRAGGDRSPYSIFMGNENIAAVLRAEGFFEPFDLAKLPNAQNAFPQFVNKDANGIRAIISPIGLAYRTDMVKTAPTSWHDLWENAEFKGRTGLYQIGNTGAVVFLRLVGELFGSGPDDFDTAFARIKELLPFTQASWSGELSTALVRGDCVIAPLDWTEAMVLQDKGAPIAIVAPKEGVLAFEQSFNLVKTGAEKDAAHAYLNYVLDAKVQHDMAAAFYTSPCNKESPIDTGMQKRTPIVGDRMAEIRSYDWDSYVDKAADIADRWNREMA